MLDVSDATLSLRNHLKALNLPENERNQAMGHFKQNLLRFMDTKSKIIFDDNSMKEPVFKSDFEGSDINKAPEISQDIEHVKSLEYARDLSRQLFREIENLIGRQAISPEHFPLLNRSQYQADTGLWKITFIDKRFPHVESARRAVYTKNDIFYKLHKTLKEQALAPHLGKQEILKTIGQNTQAAQATLFVYSETFVII